MLPPVPGSTNLESQVDLSAPGLQHSAWARRANLEQGLLAGRVQPVVFKDMLKDVF